MSDYQFRTVPYRHQRDDFYASRDREWFAWLWEMGLGKSKQLCDNVAWLWQEGKIDSVLVVCWPKQLIWTWIKDQFPIHLPEPVLEAANLVPWTPNPKKDEFNRLASLFEPRKNGSPKLDVLVMNVEALSTDKGVKFAERFLKKHNSTMMAIDESTRIKSTTSMASKRAVKLGRLAKYRRIMTGTPAPESPVDVYGQYEFLREGLTGHWSLFTFKQDFCLTEKRFRMDPKKGRTEYPVITGYQNIDRLNRTLLENGSRLLKKECLDLPAKIYKRVYVELTAKQRAAYDELMREAVLELGETDLVTAQMVITKILYLRQITCNLARSDLDKKVYWIDEDENPRFDAVGNLVEGHSGQGLVWGVFVPALQELHRYLKERFPTKRFGLIHGEIKTDVRQQLVEQLQSGHLDYLVQQTRTGGYGTTLTKATMSVYHDNDWSLETRLQSEDRNHRIGQTESVVYQDVVVRDTVDEMVVQALIRKDTLALQVTGDDWRKWIR